MSSQKTVLDNFKKICICRSITGGTIMKAIREGHLSFEALRRTLRVGTGTCKAKRCREKIEAKIKDYKEAQKITPTRPESAPPSGIKEMPHSRG